MNTAYGVTEFTFRQYRALVSVPRVALTRAKEHYLQIQFLLLLPYLLFERLMLYADSDLLIMPKSFLTSCRLI